MTRALTVVETLLALALLSALLMAVAAWTRVTARAASDHAAPLRWRAGGEAALALIGDDIACGDFGPGADAASRSRPRPRPRPRIDEPRVAVIDGLLTIRTRSSDPGGAGGPGIRGPVTHVYRVDRSTRHLQREQIGPQGETTTRALLGSVAEWTCTIDQEAQTIEVTITSETGTPLTRRWPL